MSAIYLFAPSWHACSPLLARPASVPPARPVSEGMLRSLLLVAGLAASSALAPTLTPTSPGGAQAPPPATGVQSALLDAVEEAASICLSKQRGDGSEGGLAWCDEPSRKALERSIRGLRGRKLAWWLDTPLPLRAAYTRQTERCHSKGHDLLAQVSAK